MPKFILNWKQLVGYTVLLGVLAGAQGIALAIKHNYSKVYEGNCSVNEQDWEVAAGPNVEMHLNCGGTAAWTRSPYVVTSWLNNPGDLACKVYEDSEAECATRPSKKPAGVPKAERTGL